MNFNNIKLEKSMYSTTDSSFSQILESLDPSSNYKDSIYFNLDAFQRQLKRFDIKVSGCSSDKVSKFFYSPQASNLFPEYVSRAVRQGMDEANTIKNIIATKTNIDSTDYRTITSITSESDKTLHIVSPGSLIPTTEIKPKKSLVQLKKRGRVLVAAYEAIQHQKLDLFTVSLKQIGAYIANAQLKDAVDVLINGDGNNNPAKKLTFSGAISYDNLINLWNQFDEFQLNTILVSPDIMSVLVNLPQLQNPSAGFTFATSGSLKTPLGANLIKSRAVPPRTLIGLDNRSALEMVSASDISLEYDKLIDRQLQRAAITTTVGFAKIFPDATVVLQATN